MSRVADSDVGSAPAPARAVERRCLVVSGLVQGVGFRPFVYRLATELGLAGTVRNTPAGVRIEVEGPAGALGELAQRLRSEAPANAVIRRVEASAGAAAGLLGFSIGVSDEIGTVEGAMPRDLAPCPECLREVLDPAERFYRYPFASCTRCGPRYTIIGAMPFDRRHTTMASFELCGECRRDYEDPLSRRFHAQAVACPACGPRLALWDSDGSEMERGYEALRRAADAIRRGSIVAVKGVGGFHLMVDAGNDAAVRALRLRKRRPDKPFALLCGSLEMVSSLGEVGEVEASLLCSAQAPIVLLRGRRSDVAPSVAPRNPHLGVMLPPSPLHVLLMEELRRPVVATSGNRSEEPICTDEREAVARFRGIADVLLVHDRPIARHADDSLVRVMAGEGVVLRLGRGYAPLAVAGPASRSPIAAAGTGHNNSVAVSNRGTVVLSQHVGNLDGPEARAASRRTARDLAGLLGVSLAATACDLHPDDPAAHEARAMGRPLVPIQHHHAHVVSCMAEHDLEGPVLGVAWDGTGYGSDGTIWGGEFLAADRRSFCRVGHLRRFRLPGGDRAAREPRRAALGLLFELFGARVVERSDLAPVASFSRADLAILCGMLAQGVNSPMASSAGRLFDAVAALLGQRQTATFEGQAAMELEAAADEALDCASYPILIGEREPLVVDWEPTVRAVLEDLAAGVEIARIARAFHGALADAIVAVAQRVGRERVVLTGGCFQNRHLTERASASLGSVGFRVYRHRMVPPNDGGIALGQAAACADA